MEIREEEVKSEKVKEAIAYTASIPLMGDFEIIVLGGGMSGVASSIAAARMGRKVLLIEQAGALGGMGTNGLVSAFNPFSDGVRTLVGGVGLEILTRAFQRGFLSPRVTTQTWEKGYMTWIPFSGEGMKLVLDEIVIDAGVVLRLFTSAIDVIREGKRVVGLILSSREGLSAVKGHYFVDCSGDANLATMMGFPYELGDEQGRTMPPSLCSFVANVDYAKYKATRRTEETEYKDDDYFAALDRALNAGEFSVWDKSVPGVFFSGPDYGILNAGHLFGVVGLDGEDLTRGMIRGRQVAQEFIAFHRKYVPGCEHMLHVGTAPVLGVRETRRIMGEYVLTVEDFNARRSFEDEIGRYNNPVDMHVMSPGPEEWERFKRMYWGTHRLPPGESYGIPYRSLIPKGSENLLVAGRCISTDRLMLASARPMPCCFITGHAAGVAAALCVESQKTPQALDPQLLRRNLREQGAYLP